MVKYGELEVPILFSETHYGQDLEKVKILCIKRPLTDASFEFHDEVGKYLIHEIYHSTIYIILSKLLIIFYSSKKKYPPLYLPDLIILHKVKIPPMAART